MKRSLTLCWCVVLLIGISGIGHSFQKRNVRPAGVKWNPNVDLTANRKSLQLPTTIFGGEDNGDTAESYKQNIEMKSVLYGPVNTQLLIESEYFAVEDSDDCMFDYLQLSETNRFCGSKPLVFITNQSHTFATFKSDNSYEDRGFKLNVKAQKVDELTYCNNTLTSGEIGTKSIRNVGTNACFYRVEAENAKIVQLSLGKQNLVVNRPCHEESVIIYKGRSTHGKKVAKICSDTDIEAFNALNLRAEAFFIEYRNPLNREHQAFRIDCHFFDKRVDYSDRTNGGEILKFKQVPESRNIQEGDAIYPQCVVDVPPEYNVTYYWKLNGKPIDAYTAMNKFGSDGGMLWIDEFSKDLEGEYTCIAETASGIAEHTFQYRMVTNCEIRIYPGPGESNQKNVGQNALLQCRVDPADEVKQVIWRKDGIELDTSGSGRFLKKANHYLQISDITLDDAGVYSCHAEDKNGCQTSKKGTLKVLDYRPLNKYCGISIWDEDKIASRISQGEPVRINEHPWHVNLRTKNVNEIRTFCGGSLISQKFVVTVAHCIDDFKRVFMADFSNDTVDLYFGTIDCKGGGTRRSVKSYTIHPEYSKGTKYNNDIAIIELDFPILYGISIRPICLGEKSFLDDSFLEQGLSTRLGRQYGRVVGCGSKGASRRARLPNELKVVYLPYVPRDECEESFHGITNVTASMFCAGSKVARTGDACQGDTGGGFVMNTDERWVLVGIPSFGFGCDRAGYYSVFTHVGLFYDWIKGITKFDKEQVENFLD